VSGECATQEFGGSVKFVPVDGHGELLEGVGGQGQFEQSLVFGKNASGRAVKLFQKGNNLFRQFQHQRSLFFANPGFLFGFFFGRIHGKEAAQAAENLFKLGKTGWGQGADVVGAHFLGRKLKLASVSLQFHRAKGTGKALQGMGNACAAFKVVNIDGIEKLFGRGGIKFGKLAQELFIQSLVVGKARKRKGRVNTGKGP